jgi:hypothetical protein
MCVISTDVIYDRAQTPADIVTMRVKLGLQNPDGSYSIGDANTANEEENTTAHAENWLKHYRWARVGKPSKREWERFKAARFKERQDIYNKMRSRRSLALQSFEDTDEEYFANLKSFADRWEEREERRRQAAVSLYQTKRMTKLGKKKVGMLTGDIAKKFAQISDVLDGTYKVEILESFSFLSNLLCMTRLN